MYSYVKIVQYRSCLWHSINILNRFRYPDPDSYQGHSGLLLALPLARVLQSSQVFFYTKQQSVNFPISSVYPKGETHQILWVWVVMDRSFAKGKTGNSPEYSAAKFGVRSVPQIPRVPIARSVITC